MPLILPSDRDRRDGSAKAASTFTFQATVHYAPPPDLSGNVCVPSTLTPVSLESPAPDSAWVGQWSDPQSKVEAWIIADPDQGLDFQTSEAQVACGSGAATGSIVTSVNGASDGIAFAPPWGTTVASPCVSQPPSPGVLRSLPPVTTQSLGTTDATVWLQLYTYTCAGSAAPHYKVRYTRTDGRQHLFTDYMLDYHAPLF
jgi:hypothetical protein